MKRIRIRLVGGLGNQMFQYAAARAVALRSGGCVEFDNSWFGVDPARSYALGPFAIKGHIMKNSKNLTAGERFLNRVNRYLGINKKFSTLPLFKESSFLYDSRIELLDAPVILDGYFQSEKYFLAYDNEIRAELTVSQPQSLVSRRVLEKISKTNAICIHIRRGDYITNPKAHAYHGTCSIEYYQEGLAIVSANLEQPHCFVFSDDPYWVKANFYTHLPMTVVDIHDAENAHEDLRLMQACQHFVIANSTLSWWGAWLGTYPYKKVVAPQQWFKNSAINTSDLIPSEWVRI